MQSRAGGLIIGLLLVGFGVLLLFSNYMRFRIEDYLPGVTVISLFFLIGSIFLYSKYIADKNQVWGLVLGSVALLISFAIYAGNVYYIPDEYIGVFVLWLIGTNFLVSYLRNKHIWAFIIPAGIMYTIGLIVFLETSPTIWWFSGNQIAMIIFSGFALTFGILYMMRNEERNTHWAIYPTLVFLAIAGINGMVESYYWYEDLIFPTILIVVGLMLLVRSFYSKNKQDHENGNQLETTK